MKKVFFHLVKKQFTNLIRARWLIIYTLFFFFLADGLLMFGSDLTKTVASLLNIILFIIPMISILYATIYWYNSESFIRLILAQPVSRSCVFLSSWLSLSLSLSGSFFLGTLASLLINHSLGYSTIVVLFFGSVLTFVFVGLGLLVSVLAADKAKGVGIAFMLWFYFSILHDIVVFSVVSLLKDYPIEIPAMGLMISNPIDLTRVHVLLSLELSAMMGYTGRILQDLLSGPVGKMITGMALIFWIIIPLFIGMKLFSNQDL